MDTEAPYFYRVGHKAQAHGSMLGMGKESMLVMGHESMLVMAKKSSKMNVLRMGLPGVENVCIPRASIFKLSRASQLPYIKYVF